MDLPVIEVIPLLREKLLTNRIVILQAPPGAGKSTVLPLHLLNEPWLASRKTVMMEPRRLAAKTVAQRLAQELGEPIGDTIGYRIRFESKTGAKTRLEVVTEGILTRKIQSDSSLEDVGLLIFDEFHERSLQADLALALSLQIQRLLREDLRILIMSATLDAEHLSKLLNAPVVTASGRQYPVTINYVAAESDKPVPMSVSVAIRKALRDESGDVLVFLPGSGEIRQTMKLLEEDVLSAVVVPLFGDLPFQEQQEAIMPRKDGKRKVVLATSIAETSLTIEGIRVVIDSGWSRLPRFDPSSGLTRLETVRVTRDAADQRAGRAGRLAAGVCHRLWTESTNRHLTAQRKPEILDADLAPVVLELRQWGVTDAASLPWITPPPPGAVSQAADVLEALEAIDAKGITPRGKEMVKLPTHPRIAHMLTLPGMTTSVKALAADVAAVLEERDPLDRGAGADLGLRVEALRRWRSGEKTSADRQGLMRIDRLSSQWRKFLDVEADNTAPDGFVIGRLITAAYPERIARQQSRQSDLYTLMNGLVIKLPPHDPLVHQPWICAAHVDSGKGQGKIFLASPVHEDDLAPLAHEQSVVSWDSSGGRVTGSMEKRIGSLLLSSKPIPIISDEEASRVICHEVAESELRLLDWGEEEVGMQDRLMSVKSWRPDEAWPDVSTKALINDVERWLSPYLAGVRKVVEIKKLDKAGILLGMLPWDLQQKLDHLAPQRIEVPTGSMIRLSYLPDGSPPVLEVRLQEMFGLLDTPAVNEGRMKVVLHLLSPGYKPVQVTRDLKSFWQSTYFEVRNELKRRYPKHAWPEDPLSATPVRGAKRRQ